MSSPAELDKSNVVDIDLGSAAFKANAHRHMAEWARRPPFYVLGHGQPQVIVGRYPDVHKVFSDTQTFASEMPRGPGWEQFNKIMDAQFVTQMDGEQHARVRRLLGLLSPCASQNGARVRFRELREGGRRHRRCKVAAIRAHAGLERVIDMLGRLIAETALLVGRQICAVEKDSAVEE